MDNEAKKNHRIEWAMTPEGWKVYEFSNTNASDFEVREPTEDDWAQRREKEREQEWLGRKPGIIQ